MLEQTRRRPAAGTAERPKKPEKSTKPGASIMCQILENVKRGLLMMGSLTAGLLSVWWLCAAIEGTAGGITGPLVLAAAAAWLAKTLYVAAESLEADIEEQRRKDHE